VSEPNIGVSCEGSCVVRGVIAMVTVTAPFDGSTTLVFNSRELTRSPRDLNFRK
jgi:hypothetical protein